MSSPSSSSRRRNKRDRSSYGSSIDDNMTEVIVSSTISPLLKWLTNIIGLLSVLCFSGIIFGWTPLKLMLINEGQYSELCPISEDTSIIPCAAQMDQYNQIFTMAQFLLSFESLIVGFFLDYCNKTYHYAITGTMQITGLLLFAISNTSGSNTATDGASGDYFMLGYSFMAVGGGMTMLGSFPATFLLPHHQAMFLAAISCTFDASSVIFIIFDMLYKHNPVIFSRRNMFTFFAFIGILIYGVLFCCWAILESRNWKDELTMASSTEQEERNGNNDISGIEEIEEASKGKVDGTVDEVENKKKNNSGTLLKKHLENIHMHEKSLLEQLKSIEFLVVMMFASVHMLRCNFYIETVNEILASIATTKEVAIQYATIFSFVLPCGIIFVPIIEKTTNKFGALQTLGITNGLGVVFGLLITLSLPTMKLQILNFLLFTCFRAYLYATVNTFTAVTFGVNTMGRVIGCIFTTASVCTLLQYPAAKFAEIVCGNNFIYINGIMLAICIIPILLLNAYINNILNDNTEESKNDNKTVVNDEKLPLIVQSSTKYTIDDKCKKINTEIGKTS